MLDSNGEKMGMLIGPKKVLLYDTYTESNLKGLYSEGKITKIVCPFCKKELIKIKEINPMYDGGQNPYPSTLHYRGDEYTLECLNPDCEATFTGRRIWAYID